MRRSDREVKNFEEIVKIVEQCDVCRLALNDEEYPYILPLNFGSRIEGGRLTLYFHGALEGKKYELIRKDNRACFEMDCAHRLVTDIEKGNCACTMEYQSVIGRGKIEILSEEEKYDGLCILMEHYHRESFDKEKAAFHKAVMDKTAVMKLTVEQLTGKICRKV